MLQILLMIAGGIRLMIHSRQKAIASSSHFIPFIARSQAATLSCGNAACESLTNREFKANWPVEETVYPLRENLTALGCQNDLADRTAALQCLEGSLHFSQREEVRGKQTSPFAPRSA